MSDYKKINDNDTLNDWKNKFNHNTDENIDLKNRVDILETGDTSDNEVIALRDSTTLSYSGTSADDRVEYAEGKIVDNTNRIDALENKILPVYNVKDPDYGAVGDGQTDDSAAIQAALDAANANEGGIVYVPDGDYAIKATLLIYSNTILRLSANATIIRAEAIGNMLRSGIGNVDAYNGVQNVIVEGGTWEGNSQQFPSAFTHITFGHCQNITVRDTAILNDYQHHAIEYNAVKNGKVINVLFKGFEGTRYSEAFQIDLAKSEAQYPAYGNYDNTPCDDILVSNCVFEDWSRGVGSHSATAGVYHTNIRIIGNHFYNLSGQGVRGYQYNWVLIDGNTFDTCRMAVELRPGDGTDASDVGQYVISNNTIRNMTGSEYGFGIWINGSQANIYDVIITGNTIYETNEDGIYANSMHHSTVVGNTIRRAGDQGISFNNCRHNTITGNTMTLSERHGIVLGSGSNHNVVSNNLCAYNGRSTSEENANIAMVSESNENNVQGNTVRLLNNLPTYGIWTTGTTANNIVAHNDVRNGGETPLNLTTDTITLGGNVS